MKQTDARESVARTCNLQEISLKCSAVIGRIRPIRLRLSEFCAGRIYAGKSTGGTVHRGLAIARALHSGTVGKPKQLNHFVRVVLEKDTAAPGRALFKSGHACSVFI